MKKYLITGLIILIPVALTFMIFVFVIDLFTDPFLDIAKSILLYFHETIPLQKYPELFILIARVVAILCLVGFIFFLGFLGRVFFFKSLIQLAQKILSKTPLIKGIYGVSKDVVSSLLAEGKRTAFQHPVEVQFPSDYSSCIGFVTGEIPKECQEKVKEPLTPVFVPTAPHPISGYLIMTPKNYLHEVDMTNEEAVKFTVSCGMIIPEENREEKKANL